MAVTRERKVASPDLDLFGDDTEETSADAERDGDSKSMDIFGEDAAAEADKSEAEAEGAKPEAETAGEATAEGEPDWASIFGEAEATEGKEATPEAGDETLDPEIDELLKQAEEAEEKDERDDVISTLRQKLVDQQVELDASNRQKEILNEKLMASAANDTELGMYKDVITKLDNSPKLRALVRYSDASEESAKNRAINILAEMLEDMTGQDVSSLLDKTRADKAKAALGGNSSAAPSAKPEEEKDMDYEESVSSLW